MVLIREVFEQHSYTLHAFIDPSSDFDNNDCHVTFKKSEHYGIKKNSLKQTESCFKKVESSTLKLIIFKLIILKNSVSEGEMWCPEGFILYYQCFCLLSILLLFISFPKRPWN